MAINLGPLEPIPDKAFEALDKIAEILLNVPDGWQAFVLKGAKEKTLQMQKESSLKKEN